ncbi:hypothetical protein N7517_004525 [Penicillium concentricum]|uniref:Uncharacterized protein n=1 Tax=Penicillium concentricum TaxID=293559 RepID=A0A9W9V9G8_9EURO|nr:uncharacterized protein N7517_004525 [Penicillium concentricum]KAJ5372519.1 hypothetical protein N7517_004525 [Penicillium concentricum]
MAKPEEEDVCLLDFDVGLQRGLPDDNDNGFRVQNTSPSDWQRQNSIERKGPVDIRASLIKVVHGYMGDPSADGPFATLLVFKFRFDRQKHGRRVIRARINVDFSPLPPGSSRPEVWAIDPEDRFIIVPTSDPLETTKSLGVDISTPYAGVTGSMDRTRQRNIDDATTVTGSIDLALGVNSGTPSCAS